MIGVETYSVINNQHQIHAFNSMPVRSLADLIYIYDISFSFSILTIKLQGNTPRIFISFFYCNSYKCISFIMIHAYIIRFKDWSYLFLLLKLFRPNTCIYYRKGYLQTWHLCTYCCKSTRTEQIKYSFANIAVLVLTVAFARNYNATLNEIYWAVLSASLLKAYYS